jgi:hypothetical protein
MKETIWLVSGIVIGILLAAGSLAALAVGFAIADDAAWRNVNEPKPVLRKSD